MNEKRMKEFFQRAAIMSQLEENRNTRPFAHEIAFGPKLKPLPWYKRLWRKVAA